MKLDERTTDFSRSFLPQYVSSRFAFLTFGLGPLFPHCEYMIESAAWQNGKPFPTFSDEICNT